MTLLLLRFPLAGCSATAYDFTFNSPGPSECDVRQTLVCRWSLDIASPESHQRSWWIVHTQPTFGCGTPVPNRAKADGDLSHDLLTSEPNDKLKFVGHTKENAQ